MRRLTKFILPALFLVVVLLGFASTSYASGGGVAPGQVIQQQQAAAAASCANAESPGYLLDCWSCDFFTQFASLGMNSARSAFNAIAPAFVGLLGYLFLVWVGLQAIKMYEPGANGLKIIQGIGIKAILMICVFFALGGSSATGGAGAAHGGGGSNTAFNFYNDWIFSPILDSGANLSQTIMTSFSAGGASAFDTTFSVKSWNGQVDLGTEGADRAVSTVTGLINTMQHVNGWGFFIGWRLFSNSVQWSLEALARLPAGIVLMIIFGVSLVSFPFYIIDVFLRLIFLTALAPLAIAAMLFKPTRKVTVAAISGMIQSSITLVMTGCVVGFTGALMTGAMDHYSGLSAKTFAAMACNIDTQAANSATGFGFDSSAYWFLLFAGVLSLGTMSKARGLASALFGGFDDGKSLGDRVTGMASRGMMAAASMPLGGVGIAYGMAKAGAGAAGAGGLGAGAAALGSLGSQLMNMTPGLQGIANVNRAAQMARNLTSAGMSNGNQAGNTPPNP